MNTYKYQTDSTSGTFDAATFEDAIRMLHDVLTDEVMSDGASGCVENTEDGTVYHVQPWPMFHIAYDISERAEGLCGWWPEYSLLAKDVEMAREYARQHCTGQWFVLNQSYQDVASYQD